MSFGTSLAKGTMIPGLEGSRLLATDHQKRLVEWESIPLSELASIASGSLLGRASGGVGPVESLAQLPASALPASAARLNQAGLFAELMTFGAGSLFSPLGSDPSVPVEGQVWWRSGALWMRDATGVVPFIQSGTWTPTIRPDTVGDYAAVYSVQTGIWVRVGRTVILGFNLQTSSITWTTASGTMRIYGLPFASQSGTETLGTAVLRTPFGLSLPTTAAAVYVTPTQGATTLIFQRHVPGTNTTVSGLALGSTLGFVSGQNVTLAASGLMMRIA